MHVSISKGNDKMGSIASVSLPSVLTCIEAECNKKCYARKLERVRKTVREAYYRNYIILNEDPETFWREIEAAIMLNRYFRFHVSGDIPDATYLCNMVEIARRNEHCQILCFTKKYDLINNLFVCGVEIPDNLHIILSAWEGLEMVNPNGLPEAHVRYRDGSTTARSDAKECRGNYTECALTDDGCWVLQNGEQIVFDEH